MAAAFSIRLQPVDLLQHRNPRGAGKRIAGIGMAVLEAAHVEHRPHDRSGAASAPSGA